MHSKCYVRERIEELRSRISLLSSTLEMLKENYWTIFKKCTSMGRCPPFLFPVSTFKRLENTLNSFILDINPDVEQYDLILRLNRIDYHSYIILAELNKLQDILNQRISGLGAMKLVEYQPIFQVEFSVLLKAYCAADALTFDFVKTILGIDWITDNHYFPISIFNSRIKAGYSIDLDSLVISIPYYDSFRLRFWPALAHEVSHILFRKQTRVPGPFQNAILRSCSELRSLLSSYANYPVQFRLVNTQISELTSDIIACYVCPPSYLSAAIGLSIPVEVPPSFLYRIIPSRHHPPTDSRMVAMEKALDYTDVLNVDRTLQKMAESVRIFLNRKNLVLPDQLSYNILQEYNEFAIRHSERILNLLPQIGLNPFGGNEWNDVNDAFCNIQNNDLSPIQLMCMAWVKRLHSIKDDCNLDLQDYFKSRKTEPKIFEQIIELIYKYYGNNIIKIIKEEGRFDIRFDFNQG